MNGERIRAYSEPRDLDAVLRIWREVGWVDDDSKRDALAAFLRNGNVEVATPADEAECMVHWTAGRIRHSGTDLGLCAVTAVTTSAIGRRQGFASALTARALRQGAEAGHAVAALGMFEQGFYNRLGFASAAYDTIHQFDPAALLVDHVPYRTPIRVTNDMYADMHGAMCARMRSHGAVTLSSPGLLEGEVGFAEKPFGLGYRDEAGELTHFVHGSMHGEHGPFNIDYMAYRTVDQLLELLRLLRELGDQVRTVKMVEPPHAQLQTMLREPFRDRMRTKASEHEAGARSVAWWQLRVLDVPTCVAALRNDGDEIEFNLRLDDPVAQRLDDADGWSGVGGDYTISLGTKSDASPGHRAGLPLLRAGVEGFSRLWFGVAPASALVATDRLDAPPELIAGLDRALRLPTPHPGWMF